MGVGQIPDPITARNVMTKLPMRWSIILLVVVLAAGLATAWWYWGSNIRLITGGRFSAAEKTEFGDRTVRLAMGDILLFRTPNGEYGAIQFTRLTDDWGADYSTWYVPHDSDAKQRFAPSQEYKGHVFERYWRTRTGSGYRVKDIGGVYHVECGPYSLEWSGSTWVYFPAAFVVAVVENRSIEKVDLLDDSYDWRHQPYRKE